MSILKSNNGDPSSCLRFTFAYNDCAAGEGHFIHTYKGDGNPLPVSYTHLKNLTDEMYERPAMHREDGAWQMIFGVNTLPAYRRKGYAGALLKRAIADAKRQGRKGLVLTCKEALIPYYAKFGLVNEGVSESVHGGAVWYQMRLELNNEKD